MAANLTSKQALGQIGEKLQKQYGNAPIPYGDLKRLAAELSGLQESSIIPSDFCCNRTNAGIPLGNAPMFLYEMRGLYRFVGTDYPFTGPMVHRARGGTERLVVVGWMGYLRLPKGPDLRILKLQELLFVTRASGRDSTILLECGYNDRN